MCFMDCKEAQLLTVPYILGDLNPDSGQCGKLETHLLCCPVCAKEYENNKCVVEFIGEHKVLFAEAFETIEKKRTSQQEEIDRSWQGVQAKLAMIEAQERKVRWGKRCKPLWKVAAAACIVIGISIMWLILTDSDSKTFEEPTREQIALAPVPSVKIELLSDNGNIIIPAGTKINTTANELKSLILNGKHRMVLNYDTALSIEPLLDNECVGCMVKLTTGEILTHVEHDGNPFAVSTAQGRAIITGTTFDIKATDISTTLIVADGNVRFESEGGVVEVAAGQISDIVAQSAPTNPTICDSAKLTAWAAGHELKTALAKIGSFSDAYDLTNLWVSSMSGPINLENIDYVDWIEKKQAWFEREFPWIFQLQSALAKEDVKIDYPQLLIQSGDIWQFVYPETSPQQIPILYFNPLLQTASEYGFDEQWVLTNVPTAKSASAIGNPMAVNKMFAGLKAFEEWAKYFEQVRKSLGAVDSGTVLCSLHASTYLANTRTLAWLSLNNGKHLFRPEEENAQLALLQSEVNICNELSRKIINLLWLSQSQPCDEYLGLIDVIIENIKTIMSIEEGVAEYEARK